MHNQPLKIELGALVQFSYLVNLSALPAPETYTGWKLRCDIRDQEAVLVKDFGAINILPQADGTGLAVLESSTASWPVAQQLNADLLLVDSAGAVVMRSAAFTVRINKGLTDMVSA